MMTENKKNQEFKIRKIKRGIERSCDNAKKYFWLFVVFFVAGLIVRNVMHDFFSAGIDSWKADPELNNFRYMWNILMYVIPIMLYALAAGFLAAASLSPLCEIIFGGVRIFLLKRCMRRENSFREGKPLLVLCAALLTVTPAASADVNSDMNQFFNKLGFASNTTQPGVWQGQAAGYAYGGSLYARTQVKNVQLISMTLPDINAGCGGIDAYLGSFSFINGEQLQRFVKQIMSNAAGYFFDLALQTTVPEIKTAKDFLQKMASDINSMNLSSCQAAQGIIGGLFPRTQVSQQKVCQDIAGESNIFADWAASRQGCTVGGKSDSVRDKASDKDKERVTKNINIMWNALSKNRMFDGNKELKEFVMTLTGSLVFGPNGEITPLSARTTDRSIIRAMMEGGTAKIYHCNDSDKCLKVVADTPVTISRDNALKSQITKLLASIQNKAVSDTPLDDKEKGFISSTTIPVFKYLVDPQMLGVSNSMIYQLTDYIGYDILLQYIQELIQQARAMVATGNYDEAVIGHINDNMNDATRQIAVFQSQVQVQQDALLVVDRQMSYMRQQLSARMLSRYQNNYHFGGSTL